LQTNDSNTGAGKLLRLRKKLPTTEACQIVQANCEAFVKPHFRNCDLVDQYLVEIKSSGIIKVLNQELKKWEMMPWDFQSPSMVLGRPTKRQGIYLADDCHGLLIQDMTPGTTYSPFEINHVRLIVFVQVRTKNYTNSNQNGSSNHPQPRNTRSGAATAPSAHGTTPSLPAQASDPPILLRAPVPPSARST
jgi:hypothetical protein